MVAAQDAGRNVLTKEILDIVFELNESILAMEASTPSLLNPKAGHLQIEEYIYLFYQ